MMQAVASTCYHLPLPQYQHQRDDDQQDRWFPLRTIQRYHRRLPSDHDQRHIPLLETGDTPKGSSLEFNFVHPGQVSSSRPRMSSFPPATTIAFLPTLQPDDASHAMAFCSGWGCKNRFSLPTIRTLTLFPSSVLGGSILGGQTVLQKKGKQ